MKPADGSPARASLWFGASLYLNGALLFLATPVFTRLLSTAEFGEVVLYNAWAVVLGIFATLSLSGGVFYSAMLEFADDLDAYVSSMLGLSSVCVLACFAMVGAVVLASGDFTGLGGFLLGFMFLWFACNAALQFWQGRERLTYRYRLMAAISIPSSVLGVFAAIALVALLPGHRVEARVVAVALPTVLVGLALYVVLLRRGGTFYSRRYWGYALALNVPLLPHYLAQAFILQFDRFAIEQAAGKAEVGLYGLACAIASGATLLWTAINASWVPWMMRKLREGSLQEIAARSKDLTGAVAFACALLALAAPEIVALLAPPSYHAAAGVVPLLLLASCLQFAGSVFLNVQFFRKRALAITACSVASALLNVAGNLYFIERHGFAAAAWVIAASQLFQLGVHYAIVRGVDRSRVIGGRFLAGLVCAAVLAAGAATLLQRLPALRWSLFVLLAAAFCLLVYRRYPARAAAGGAHG